MAVSSHAGHVLITFEFGPAGGREREEGQGDAWKGGGGGAGRGWETDAKNRGHRTFGLQGASLGGGWYCGLGG